MNGLKKSGWKYWDYFQAINPGTSVKGQHAFSALHAVPDDNLGMPSDDKGVTTTSSVTTTTSVMTSTSHPHPHHSPMNVDNATADSSNKRRLSITSLSRSLESNQYQHHRQLSATALACTQRRQRNQSLAPWHIHHQVKPQSHPPMSASWLPNLRHHQLRRL